MSEADAIKVYIRNLEGEYLSGGGDQWCFTADPARAHVFDYLADAVVQHLERAQLELGVIWVAWPLDPSLLSEICDRCGRRLYTTEARFDGTRSLCPACAGPAG